MIDEELARCAQINFENFEKDVPMAAKHPFYMIAKRQLNEAIGEGETLEECAEKLKGEG